MEKYEFKHSDDFEYYGFKIIEVTDKGMTVQCKEFPNIVVSETYDKLIPVCQEALIEAQFAKRREDGKPVNFEFAEHHRSEISSDELCIPIYTSEPFSQVYRVTEKVYEKLDRENSEADELMDQEISCDYISAAETVAGVNVFITKPFPGAPHLIGLPYIVVDPYPVKIMSDDVPVYYGPHPKYGNVISYKNTSVRLSKGVECTIVGEKKVGSSIWGMLKILGLGSGILGLGSGWIKLENTDTPNGTDSKNDNDYEKVNKWYSRLTPEQLQEYENYAKNKKYRK